MIDGESVISSNVSPEQRSGSQCSARPQSRPLKFSPLPSDADPVWSGLFGFAPPTASDDEDMIIRTVIHNHRQNSIASNHGFSFPLVVWKGILILAILLSMDGAAVAAMDSQSPPARAVVGSFDVKPMKMLKEEEQMVQDSPFNPDNFERQKPQYSQSLRHPLTIGHSISKMSEYYKDREFVQIHSEAEGSYLLAHVNSTRGVVFETTKDKNDNRTWFQFDSLASGSGTVIENVLSCLYICMNLNGELYTTTELPLEDRFCHFNDTLRELSSDGNSLQPFDVLISLGASNSSHSLILTSNGPVPNPPKGNLVTCGQESTETKFLFETVRFETIQASTKTDQLQIMYKSSSRREHYCPEIIKHSEIIKHLDKVTEKPGHRRRRRQRCKRLPNRADRKRCRQLRRCIARSRQLGLDPRWSLCTAQDRDDAPARKKVQWPWQKTDACYTLRFRSERKLCLRRKRRQCRRHWSQKFPSWSRSRVKDMCRTKNWFERCVHKKMSRKKTISEPKAKRKCERRLKRRLRRREKKKLKKNPDKSKRTMQNNMMRVKDIKWLFLAEA